MKEVQPALLSAASGPAPASLVTGSEDHIVWFENSRRADVGRVGGKNASLGEMVSSLSASGIVVPPGFATTASAFWLFLDDNHLREPIWELLSELDAGKLELSEAGGKIRQLIRAGHWPESVSRGLVNAYSQLSRRLGSQNSSVAVRSSATAEDLPEASFAGQQESFLNIRGKTALLNACRECFASLFTDRAIAYRIAQGFDHAAVALSVGVQAMVRSDKGSAGVMFTIDTETGFDGAVLINSSWGLGESVVKGTVDPDEFVVFKPFLDDRSKVPIIAKKPGSKETKLVYARGSKTTRTVNTPRRQRQTLSLSDDEVMTLARWGVMIESHYGCPMDVEWAKDGLSGKIYIVQARPETVQSTETKSVLHNTTVTGMGSTLCSGIAVGSEATTGKAFRIDEPGDASEFEDGSILVARNTDPDWVPLMKRARAIVTDHGGRTSHAAIVSRELGLPAIVGTGDATKRLEHGQGITVSCCEGDVGYVYEGTANITQEDVDLAAFRETQTKIMLNVADPSAALRWWRLPHDGVGLARMEFVYASEVGIHPLALLRPDNVPNRLERAKIRRLTSQFDSPSQYLIEKLSRGLARIAALAHPNPAIIRFSDFKSNEYAHLLGGSAFEAEEANPMIGWRGASRYYAPDFREAFALECAAIRHLRIEIGFSNVAVMVPFCRTLHEARQVLDLMAANGLLRGQDGLKVFLMCEVPSNVILVKQFAELFDGFSIGSNDLTQLTLGVDRDNRKLSGLFDEDDAAVRWMIEHAIDAAHSENISIGLCGQAPSDRPAFSEFLVNTGIDSISVTPDSFASVKKIVARCEVDGRRRH